jgi:pimeloyl-ACP methyl ester carboxylesterase
MNARAVIAHGAGSSADFVSRAFGEPLAAAGYDVVSWDRRTPVAAADLELAELVARTGATIVGGMSVGALLATRFALSPEGARLDGLLVALPPPPPRADTTDDDDAGVPEVDELIELACRTAVPWVAAEIRAAWPTYEPMELLRELRTASVATTPTAAELAKCRVPTGVVALADDPVHPVEIAAMWANAIPRAALETVPLTGPATGVSVIGAAAVRAWQRARAVSGSQ